MAKPQRAKAATPAQKTPKPAQKPQKRAQKPQKHAQKFEKPTPSGAHTTNGSDAAVLQRLTSALADPNTSWFSALKPLKPLPAAATTTTSSRRKTKAKGGKARASEPEKPEGDAQLPAAEAEAAKRHAQRLLEAEVARFEAQKSARLSSDDKYLATMMRSGTLADRVAALTLTVQSAPFHNLARLSQLITMASKKARRESMMAVDSLKDLFINNLLPDDRRLRFFHQHALAHPDATDEHRALWFFEHCLKTAFAQLVGVLASGMDDAVDNHKRACIRAASALLAAKPEQEAVLLAMLVNKLGDPDRKIASYVLKTLQELLQEHPAMKRVVVDEVERVLTRPQVSDRTKYNAILFLNQMYLDKSGDDADLAAHLITVYFGLFTKEVHGDAGSQHTSKGKGQRKSKKHRKSEPLAADGLDRKLLSALLVGVNRAFPYAKATSAQFHDEIDALFTVVHRAHHSTSVQALMLLFQVMSSTNSVSDRFYTALYDKLFDPKVRESSKHTLFLNLIFRAMKADVSPARASAMVKRLLQLTTVMTPAFTCAVLFLLSELLKLKPALRTLLDQPEAGAGAEGRGVDASHGGDDEYFVDAKAADDSDGDEPTTFTLEQDDDDDDEEETDEEGNVAEAPERNDDGLTDAERTQKVLEQMFGKAPASRTGTKKATATFDESDSENDDDDNEPKLLNAGKKAASTATVAVGDSEGSALLKDSYDPRKRNPLFANADKACAWELHHLVHHYHPSVQMFARQLLENRDTGIQYAGDPLVDFTMHAFFEKFVNKKPRHKGDASASTSAAAASASSHQRAKGWIFAPINTEAVLQAAEESVDESDKFFYKFFKERAAREGDASLRKKKKKKPTRGDDDRNGDAFSDAGSDDEELEAYAQELAEGIMKDGELDDEDPDMDEWSDDDDGDNDDDDDGAELDDEKDDRAEEEEEEEAAVKSQKKMPPAPKRKSPFASADDYETMVAEALGKREAAKATHAKKKQKRS
ncbi:hypothetical protein PybrP1_005220 [[Pythium] brassicae (nom. inval.)]|nr:hypothetical protein PybrP1_005220 [[Pythium] brassicae (nom. inval.)]